MSAACDLKPTRHEGRVYSVPYFLLYPLVFNNSGSLPDELLTVTLAAGSLTPNGATIETLLGSYYRLWLTGQGLLTGNDAADAEFLDLQQNEYRIISTFIRYVRLVPQNLASLREFGILLLE